MTGDAYVRYVLAKYRVRTGPGSPAHSAGQALGPLIRRWAGGFLLAVKYSGSYAKGTAVAGGTDVDLFISLAHDTPRGLWDIYSSLFDFLQEKQLAPRRQNVSIGLTYGDVKVDLVLGRKHSGQTNDHSIYRSQAGTWARTDVDRHVSLIEHSGRTREIRAIKIWRQLHGLDFPSIYLELVVLEALNGRETGQLAANVLAVLEYLGDTFPRVRLVDPANANNTISEELSATGRALVAQQARRSRRGRWEDIVW